MKQKESGTTKKQSGQSVVEYIIMTGLIGLFCLGAVKSFGGKLKDRIQAMEKKVGSSVHFR